MRSCLLGLLGRGRRFGRIGVVGVVGALSLSACGGGGLLSTPQDTPEPAATQTVAPLPGQRTAKPTPSGQRTAFDGVVLHLPAEWRLAPTTDGVTCVLPPGQTSCLGGALMVKLLPASPSPAVDWPAATLDQPGGWQGSAPPVCYAPGAVDPDHANLGQEKISARSTVKLADGSEASYRQWEVPCASGKQFTAKLWYVAAKRVVLYSMGANPDYGSAYDQIVTGTDLSGYK